MSESELQSAPSLVPDEAPFTAAQRGWLDELLAELASTHGVPQVAVADLAVRLTTRALWDDLPWRQPSLPLDERMSLAQGRPFDQRLMAALGQQDCRQCGYDCQSYAQAVSALSEARLNLCVPGGKETQRMLDALLAERRGGAPAFDAETYRQARDEKNKPPAPETREGYCRDRPVPARFALRRLLNEPSSEKATYHIEIDIEAAGVSYAPGDAFGVYVENDPLLVDAVIAALGAPAEAAVGGRPLREVLINDVSLRTPPDALFASIACVTGGEQRTTAKRLAHGEDPDGDAASLDVLATLEKFAGAALHPEAFVDSLDPLHPRLYSIASSQRATPGRVSLAVDHVRYQVGGRLLNGAASSFLAERAAVGGALRVYVQQAPHFRLPEDDDTPVVMIGPGTGIAPFRAFLQERRARGARGKNWLFFGHRSEAQDYLYAQDLEDFRADGVLDNLSLAWSRDGDGKNYVHHRMLEEGETLWDWIYDGAHIYVCGDAKRMAVDVERALVEVVADYGNRDTEAAEAFLDKLRRTGRYQKDVY
jgi:sulfite reductase (NADPH) flavoprotein alpha-component